MLEPEDRLGVEQVRLALAAPLVLAADRRARGARARCRRAGYAVAVAAGDLLGDHVEPDAAELGGRAGEVAVDELLATGRRASKIWAPV